MDIPLKSQPQVSVLNDAYSALRASNGALHLARIREVPLQNSTNTVTPEPSKSPDKISRSPDKKLTRTYSETEKNNFDDETGARLYDDGRIRRRARTPRPPRHREFEDLHGLEDEYIPGLDFGDMVYQWSDERPRKKALTHSSGSNTPSLDNTPSRDGSYLDLNSLHAQVAPQPIRVASLRGFARKKPRGEDKREERDKIDKKDSIKNDINFRQRQNQNIQNQHIQNQNIRNQNIQIQNDVNQNDNQNQNDLINNSYNFQSNNDLSMSYEAILNSLPANFAELPYSQRKRIVSSFLESVDYSQFSLYARTHERQSGLLSGPNSAHGSFVRRSRRSSVNTVAGRLLASSTDLKRLESDSPKRDVDERGAVVMGYTLGKIIGFGAWGTIRECTDATGVVRAIKIVKARGTLSGGSPVAGDTGTKVLDAMKKEISVWQRLDHPNILPLLQHLETDAAVFCITNRIYGGTLFEIVLEWGVYNNTVPVDVKRQRERLAAVTRNVRQIVVALAYMHDEKGVVHGDLKLENVLVEGEKKSDERDKSEEKKSGDENEEKKSEERDQTEKKTEQTTEQTDEKTTNPSHGTFSWNPQLILCDFGMARVFNPRASRHASRRGSVDDDDMLMMRSRSSMTTHRRPYGSPHGDPERVHAQDDLRIGVTSMMRPHGPSLQSFDLTPTQSASVADFKRLRTNSGAIDADLPHTHIGLLPYAAPELLSPAPPPLGPLADVWALGVLVFTMCVGRLPFQHQYEPRLRAIISAGQYSHGDLHRACLLEWECDDEGFALDARKEELTRARATWDEYRAEHNGEFHWLADLVEGCLQQDITKRWDLDAVAAALEKGTQGR